MKWDLMSFRKKSKKKTRFFLISLKKLNVVRKLLKYVEPKKIIQIATMEELVVALTAMIIRVLEVIMNYPPRMKVILMNLRVRMHKKKNRD